MKHKHPARYALLLAILVGLATYAYADGFAPPQGSGGGGGSQTPWTSAIDAAGYALSDVGNVTIDGTTVLGDAAADTVSLGSTNLFAFGGTSSTYPAMRYGSSAGVIEALRADGSAGLVTLKATSAANGIRLESDDGTRSLTVRDAGLFVSGGEINFPSGDGNLTVSVGNLTLQSHTGYVELYTDSQVAVVGSNGLSVVGDDAFHLKDVTSTPTSQAGFTSLYSLNTSGLQTLKAVGSGGQATTLHVNGGKGVAHVIGCALYNSGGSLTPGTGANAITYDAEHYDSHGFHSTASDQSRITIPVGLGGVYQVTVFQRIDVNTPSGYVSIGAREGGATYLIESLWYASTAEANNYVSGCGVVRLADGAYLEVVADISGGASRTIAGTGAKFGGLTVTRIGD